MLCLARFVAVKVMWCVDKHSEVHSIAHQICGACDVLHQSTAKNNQLGCVQTHKKNVPTNVQDKSGKYAGMELYYVAKKTHHFYGWPSPLKNIFDQTIWEI